MAEYINRDATIKAIHDVYEYGFPTASGAFDDFATKIVPSLLNSIPAADVAPVVRCKDCVHWDDDPDTYGADYGPKGKCMKSFETMCADDFCSYGERKDGGAE